MNKAILMGRLTRDPELKMTANNIAVCKFTLAVDRRFKNQQGERETDFIPIVTWRQTAEFVDRYFKQGSKMVLVGNIQVRSWDDNEGKRRWMTEVIADEVYFAESKSTDESRRASEGNQGGYNRSNAGGSSYGNNRGGRSQSQNQGGGSRGAQQDQNQQEQDAGFFEAPDDDIGLPFDL